MSEEKTKWTRYRLTFHRPGVIYEPIYRKKIETVERLARTRLVEDDEWCRPYKATIEVCHTRESRGWKSWKPVKVITKEEAIRDAVPPSS